VVGDEVQLRGIVEVITISFSGAGPTNNDGTVNILVSDQT
jgi:hypothetical protein